MDDEIIVGIGELLAAHNPVTLSCLGLGSCVAVALIDKDSHVGGLAHVMLPDSKACALRVNNDRDANILNKYADVAISKLVEKMVKKGANKNHIIAKVVGGARMFQYCNSESMDIGRKNIEIIKRILYDKGIQIEAEDIGGTHGRSVRFNTATGKLVIKSIDAQKEL
ncbi:chemotaxis protein CheD [Candidatus Woesearchaeota archaeon]|nr:chemotaxis protein CheD [Candidatus Woesearchaeota archaeon]